jgi:molybdopterin/thiamine biosynthesis adenylyltransferase
MDHVPLNLPILVPCPSTEAVLLEDGSLRFVPIRRGRDQLQVDAPWGRMVHDVVVRGRRIEDCVATVDRPQFDALLRRLAAGGRLIPAERLGAVDVARYDRQVRWFAQEGADGPLAQRRLASATVLMIGVGGFGASVAELLARAGVGTLALVDVERVEEEHLPGHLVYNQRDIGVRKAFAAANRLEGIAGDLRVVPVDLAVDGAAAVARLVRRFRPDLLVCAVEDRPDAVRQWIDESAFAHGVPVLHGGARAPLAYVGPLLVPGETRCFRCFVIASGAGGEPGLAERADGLGVAGHPVRPAAGWADAAAATLAAGQAVAHLTGVHVPSILGRQCELDTRTLQVEWIGDECDPGFVVDDAQCTMCRALAPWPQADAPS